MVKKQDDTTNSFTSSPAATGGEAAMPERQINLSQLVKALNGDIVVQLQLAQETGVFRFQDVPEGVKLRYDEHSGTVTLSGDAVAIRLFLTEVSFSPYQNVMDVLDITIHLEHDTKVEDFTLSLSFQPLSNYFVINEHSGSSGHVTPAVDAPDDYVPFQPGLSAFDPQELLVEVPPTVTGELVTNTSSEPLVTEKKKTLDDGLLPIPEAPAAPPPSPAAPTQTISTQDIEVPTAPEEPVARIPGGTGATLRLDSPISEETYDEETVLDLADYSAMDAGVTLTVTLTLSDIAAGSLSAPSVGTATSTFDVPTGTLTITGDTVDVNTALADLQFTPTVDYDQDFTIQVNLVDGGGQTANSTIPMLANGVDDPITLDTPIADQAADTGISFSFTPPAGTFGNPDTLDVITYSAEQTDGSALPAWLSVDPDTGELSGIPDGSDIGTLSIRLIADDGNGNMVNDEFDLVISSALNVTNHIQTNNLTEDMGALNLPDISMVTNETSATITLTLSDATAGTLSTGTSGSVTSTFNGATGVWQASGAIASINQLLADLSFTPSADYDQNFTVNVSIDDGNNPVQNGTITMNVTAVNDAPVLDTPETDKITVATNAFALDISDNFSDVDTGETLTYTATLNGGGALPGWLSLNSATGVFSGTPGVGDIATLDVIVTVTDSGSLNVTDQFIIDVSAGGLIIGTPGDDSIVGTNGANEIWGRAGDDTIKGQNGDDTIYGEEGDDFLDGGYHRDSIEGGDGNDTLIGGSPTNGNDRQDTLKGDDGDDYIDGGYHHDSLYGGAGNDTIYGGLHNDRLYAGDGINFLSGGTQTDYLYGETGSTNQLIGGAHRDLLYGGTGQDIFSFRVLSDSQGGNRDTIYNFTQGVDKIDLSALGYAGFSDLTITPGGTTVVTAANGLRIDFAGNIPLTAADFIFSANAADIAIADQILQIGNAWNMPLTAGTFASIDDSNLTYSFFTAGGAPVGWWAQVDASTGTLTGAPQASDAGLYNVVLRATNGSGDIAEETFSITIADNVIIGTAATDTLSGTADADAIYGLADADSIDGGNGDDIIDGGDGNDTINSGNDNDSIYAGDGDDSVDGGTQADLIYGGDGDDVLRGGPNNTNNDRNDTIYGEAGDDTIYGGRYHDSLYGGDGNDYIDGEIHNDRIYGGAGNDTLFGNDQNDTLYAGSGNDVLNAGTGNDRTYGDSGLNIQDGWTGTDYYYGGSGTDLFTFSGLGHSTADRIYNFAQGTDKIDLSALGFTGIGDLTITQGGTTTIVDPNSTFKINVMSNVALTAADFIFSAPAADGDITDQMHTVNTPFNVTLGAGHFVSIDDGNLFYDVSSSNGSVLPGWLSFDDGTLTLSGTPTTNGYYDITIRAINGSGDIAEDQFVILVGENIVTGTPAADTLTGGATGDVISGLADDDSIVGNAGKDLILGNEGDDTIAAGNDRDTVYGGDGADNIDGGYERDTVYGGDGNDTIYGSLTYSTSDREDYLYGEGGNDYIDGGYHHDRLYGGDGNDTLFGNNNNDYLYGGQGNDLLLGGANDDRLYGQFGFNLQDGGTGRDFYYSGTGTDIYIFSALTHSTADRIYNFDQGTDKIDLSKLGFTGIGDLTITQGGTTTIVDPNSTFKINVMSNVALTAADFIFSAPAADGDVTLETAEIGSAYVLATGAAHFASIDDGNLIYTATLSNGNPIPAWLSLDSATGSFSGTPGTGDAGSFDIIIRATNGSGAIAEDTFELMVADSITNGTPGNDTLAGTANDDAILGLASDDSITGAAGNDILRGDEGNDTIFGEDGTDTINGGDGADWLHGGNARDTIYGGDGNDIVIGGGTGSTDHQDRLYGEAGNDTLDGGYHHDTLYGGDGSDMVYGNRHNDWLYGGDGRDFLHGGNDSDRLYGQDGDDLLIGWHGRDSFWGGDGDDIMLITNRAYSAGGNRAILYDFVQGEDRIDLSYLGLDDMSQLTIETVGTTTRITEPKTTFRIDIQDNVTLTAADFIFSVNNADLQPSPFMAQTGVAFTQALAAGTFASIDDGNLRYFATQSNGNALPTWLNVDADTGTISGLASAAARVSITIRAINDSGDIAETTLGIGVSDTSTTGTAGNDTLNGSNGISDGFDGLAGDDVYSGGSSNDAISGGDGNDTLSGDNNDDFIDGGDGDDSIDGGFHRDLIFGGAGNDTLIGGSNTSNNDREDTIFGGDGDDTIHGGRYHDQLYGDAGNDTINGGIHNDTLWGGTGNDSLDGSSQNDWLYGEDGNDTLLGGSNNDALYGGDGNDTLDGGAHRDVLWGGAGSDEFAFSDASHSGGGNIDRIMDFTRGTDLIDLSVLGLTGFGDLTVTDNGTITTIAGGGLTFELHGVYTLDATDFMF